jgi:hypothetical protein
LKFRERDTLRNPLRRRKILRPPGIPSHCANSSSKPLVAPD